MAKTAPNKAQKMSTRFSDQPSNATNQPPNVPTPSNKDYVQLSINRSGTDEPPAKLSKMSNDVADEKENMPKKIPVVAKAKLSVSQKRKQMGNQKRNRSVVPKRKQVVKQKRKAKDINKSLVPEHWKQYPKVIRGAIAEVLKRFTIQNKMEDMRKALEDVLISGKSVADASRCFSVHPSTLLYYIKCAKEETESMIGSEPIEGQEIGPTTTYLENSHGKTARKSDIAPTADTPEKNKNMHRNTLGKIDSVALISDPKNLVPRKTGFIRFTVDVEKLVDSVKLFSSAEAIGGVQWRVGIVRRNNSVDLRISSEKQLSVPLDVNFVVLLVGSKKVVQNRDFALFNGLKRTWEFRDVMSFHHFSDPNNGFIVNIDGKLCATIHAEIFLNETTVGILAKFSNPVLNTQPILVNGRKLYLNTKLLTDSSALLKIILKTEANIDLTDVAFDDFVQLLDFLHSGLDGAKITMFNAECLLKPALKFEMKNVLNQCERFLIDHSASFTNGKLLFYAQQYCLPDLEKLSIGKIVTLNDLMALKKDEDFKNLTDGLVRKLFDNAK